MILSSQVFWEKFLTTTLTRSRNLAFKFKKRCFESSARSGHSETQLTQTMLFVQEDKHIREVPLIVRKITDIGTLLDSRNKKSLESSVPNHRYSDTPGERKKSGAIHKKSISRSIGATAAKSEPLKRSISIETDEGTAILFCPNIEYLKDADVKQVLSAISSGDRDKEIYSLLESKTADEINCRIALQGLKKMIELENGWYRHRKSLSGGQTSAEAINRDIILRQLVNLITKSHDSEMILQGLKILRRDRYSPTRSIYKDWMCNEAMIRATDGDFTISQLIRIIRILASYKDFKYRNCIDILWAGLACREEDIKPDFLVPLFRSLKYFRQSKDMVQIILEKKLSQQWVKLTGTQMANILDSFYEKEPTGCLSSASKWASVSMTASTEKDLANFIYSLHTKSYIDKDIEQALERYVTIKGAEMKDSNLVASIMDYCKDLKLRNPYILAECGKYFIRHGMEISPFLLSSVLTPFGLLNTQPPDPVGFWKMFDQVLSVRFSDLKPNDVLDILLSCTYLERYPIQFLDKVFSSYLLGRLQIQRDAPVISRFKLKLILFDATMSLECKDYLGSPVNINRNTKLLNLDVRIRGIINKIYKPLAHLVGGENKLSRSVVLHKLPLINFYILDVLVHPLLKSMPIFNLNLDKKRNVNTAILIHLPEYYCWNTHHLIGPQIMRKRQIRKLGFRVACLDYAKLAELVNQDDKLLSYLSRSLDTAEDAL